MSTLREVGGYQLGKQIGQGASSVVYVATDSQGEEFALKLLHPAVVDEETRRRLRREVELINSVRSTQVARVHDFEIEGDEPFIVTDLVLGPTLAQAVAQRGPMSLKVATGLGQRLANVLSAVHEAGVVHRDLKPANIIMASNGPVLIDFGVAQMADATRMTAAGLVSGTAGYVPTEVLQGQAPGMKADWWAWAGTILFALTGQPPFGTGPQGTVLTRVLNGQVNTANLPPKLSAFFQRLLTIPLSQFPPAEDVIAGLDDLQVGGDGNVAFWGSESTQMIDTAGMTEYLAEAHAQEEVAQRTELLAGSLDETGQQTETLDLRSSSNTEPQWQQTALMPQVPSQAAPPRQNGWPQTEQMPQAVASATEPDYYEDRTQTLPRIGARGATQGMGDRAQYDEQTRPTPFGGSSSGWSNGREGEQQGINGEQAWPGMNGVDSFDEATQIPPSIRKLPHVGLGIIGATVLWAAGVYRYGLGVLLIFLTVGVLVAALGLARRKAVVAYQYYESFGFFRWVSSWLLNLPRAVFYQLFSSVAAVSAGGAAWLFLEKTRPWMTKGLEVKLSELGELGQYLWGEQFMSLPPRTRLGIAACSLVGILVYWVVPSSFVRGSGTAQLARWVLPIWWLRALLFMLIWVAALVALWAGYQIHTGGVFL
ncbi:serine/threonine protein kinase [Boudabousia tangfeifanii]|nr:serine/threonine-protein kinase [Boudabousia tangfeifanii]